MSETPTRSRRRKWLFRLAAVLIPVLLLVVLEFAFRLAGVGEVDPWRNRHVSFVSGERFFPGWDDSVVMPKPPGVTRIFVFGGSAVLAYKMDSWVDGLTERLSTRLPDRRFEVVNGGKSAFGSHRVLEVMKEAAEFDPDLFVVYTGHNEFLEEIFFDPDGFLARQERFTEAVSRLRIIRVLRRITGVGVVELPRPNVQRHFLGNENFPLIRDPGQYRLRLEFLRENVTQMVRLSRGRAVPLLLMPAVPSYLWAPGDPEHGPGYEGNAEEWEARYAEGLAEWEAGNSDLAAAAFRAAAAIDDRYATLHHHLGLAELLAGREAEARALLARAVDLDMRGDRASPAVRQAITQAGLAEPGAGVRIFDAAPALMNYLRRDFDRLSVGREDVLFIDHCHLSEEGHEILSALVADEIVRYLGN